MSDGSGMIRVALVELAGADVSRKSNLADLTELLGTINVVPIPYLENFRAEAEFIRASAKKLQNELAGLLEDKKNPPDTEAEGTFP